MSNTIAVFQISMEEDRRFQLDFTGLVLAGRTLRVNVRVRSSNTLKVSLEAPANLTLVGDGNLTVFYGKAGMAGWARTEYEADIVDETGGRFTRIMAVRFIYDAPGNLVYDASGNLVYGVRGNQATVKRGGDQAVVTAIGGVGPPGPANTLTIGDVDRLETGEDATASINGAAPNQTLNLGLPKGNTGNKGWAPVFGLAADGERFVFVLAGWVGGEGDPPPVTSGGGPLYVGAAGYTTYIAAAFDTRGQTGDKGDKGWSPKLVAVPDGARRVLRVIEPGSIEGDDLADHALPFTKMQEIPGGVLLGRGAGAAGDIGEQSASEAFGILGITTPGSGLVTAATKAAQRAALQITSPGEALVLAPDVATQRAALGQPWVLVMDQTLPSPATACIIPLGSFKELRITLNIVPNGSVSNFSVNYRTSDDDGLTYSSGPTDYFSRYPSSALSVAASGEASGAQASVAAAIYAAGSAYSARATLSFYPGSTTTRPAAIGQSWGLGAYGNSEMEM